MANAEEFRRQGSHLYEENINNSRLILFADLDGTWMKGCDEERRALHGYWQKLCEEYAACLIYNTGRPLEHVRTLIEEQKLMEVDYYICNNGCNIYYRNRLWSPWITFLSQHNCSLGLFADVERSLNDYKSTTPGMVVNRAGFLIEIFIKSKQGFNACVREYMNVKAYLEKRYSSPSLFLYCWTQDELDLYGPWNDSWIATHGLEIRISPAFTHESKGPAAQFIAEQFSLSQVQRMDTSLTYTDCVQFFWAGDWDNDLGMLNNKNMAGIVVANASKLLKDKAREAQADGCQIVFPADEGAAGVLEGLKKLVHST